MMMMMTRVNLNPKTLILKDSRSIWTYPTASPCYTANTNKHDYTTNIYYETDTDRQTDRQAGRRTETDRQRPRPRQTDRDRQTETERQTDRHSETDRQTEKHRETDRNRERQTERSMRVSREESVFFLLRVESSLKSGCSETGTGVRKVAQCSEFSPL